MASVPKMKNSLTIHIRIPMTNQHRKKSTRHFRHWSRDPKPSARSVWLVGLGEDNEPSGVAGGFASQHHVAAGAEGLGFLQQHFSAAEQADGNFSVFLLGHFDGRFFAEFGGLGFSVRNRQFF